MACGHPVLERTPADADRLSRLTAAAPGTLVQKMQAAYRDRPKPAPGVLGEKRTVTTLLVDVIRSTKLAQQLDVETWKAGMNHAFDLVAPVIYEYEGTIVRLLEDSLLAFFGAPIAHEDDPQRSVQAGLEIITLIKQYALVFNQTNNVDFAVRVCINTGPVVLEPASDDMHFEYTATDETVNLTTRMKFASTAMSVLVTENTHRYIDPYFECSDLGELNVKGETEHIRIFQVNSARAVFGRTRGFAELTSPMVGRDNELTTLLRLCEAVRAGLGRSVLLIGELGLGKTRLIQEWQQAIELENSRDIQKSAETRLPAGRWVMGRSASFYQGLAYQLLMDLLRNMMGVTIGSEEEQTHAALVAMTRDLLGDQMMEVYPYLGHLFSLKLEGEALERAQVTDPQALQTHYLFGVQKLFQALMKRSPLMLVLEDLHWADDSSTELFTKLLPLVSSGPILFCLTTRPEMDAPGWRLVNAARDLMGGSLTEITLTALSEPDTRKMVSNLLQIDALPAQVRDLILKKADGNPFFVEEVIRMLIDKEAIIYQDNTWVARREITTYDIPDNLQGLLLARIDRLPVDARYTLLVASVIGRNFPVRVLSHVMQRSQP
jgi:class 3 adenylate cyclase